MSPSPCPFSGLDAYTEDLEEPLLTSTRTFYARRREDWIASDSTPDYLIKAEASLDEEKARVTNYLNSHSEPKVLKVCEEEVRVYEGRGEDIWGFSSPKT